MIDYFVSVSQEQYDSDDPANPCTNYPTEEYSNYADCDDQFVRRSLPPDLKPFWAVDDIREASNSYSVQTTSYSEDQTGLLVYT